MFKAKKAAAIFISTLLFVSVLAGCGNNIGGSAVAGSTASAVGSDDPKPELKALVSYKSSLDYNNYPVQQFLEEKTGYKVKYDVLPQDKGDDKLNMIISSGEEYDYVITSLANYRKYAQQGALIELEPLVEKFGPNISSNVPAEMFNNVRIKGKYYCIPTGSPSGREESTNVKSSILVRQDWLDKLGLKIPTTIYEFTDMLQQFKDKDPNGTGAKNIPLTIDQAFNFWDHGIGGAFGLASTWNDVDGKLVPRVMMPGFKDYILYLKELYTKGLIDKEAPTNQGSTAKEKFTSGRAGAMPLGYFDIPQIADTMEKTQPNYKTTYIPPLAGKGGKAALSAGDLNFAMDNCSIIPQSSKKAEDVIKYFNLKLVEETFKEMVIGQENVHFTVKDGEYYPIAPKFFDERGDANQYLTGATKEYGKYWLARARKDQRQYDGWVQLNGEYAQYIVINPISKAPTIEAVSKYEQSLDKLTADFVLKGVVDEFTDATLEQFITEWKSQGGEQMVKEVNDWYSATKK